MLGLEHQPLSLPNSKLKKPMEMDRRVPGAGEDHKIPVVKRSRGKEELTCGTTSNQQYGAGLPPSQVAMWKNLKLFWQESRKVAPKKVHISLCQAQPSSAQSLLMALPEMHTQAPAPWCPVSPHLTTRHPSSPPWGMSNPLPHCSSLHHRTSSCADPLCVV